MIEYITRYITAAQFDLSELPDVVSNSRFKNCRPNFPSDQVMFPSDLCAEAIKGIIEALGKDSVLTKIQNKPDPEKPAMLVNPNLALSYHDRGESKWCYVLEDRLRRKMAVILGGLDFSTLFPEDPKLVSVAKSFDVETLSYSDLNTYFSLPVFLSGENFTVPSTLTFQEWGGSYHLNDHDDPAIATHAQRVRMALRSRNCTITDLTQRELSHPRHYLIGQGIANATAVIDIPCERAI